MNKPITASFNASLDTLHEMLGWVCVHVKEGGYSPAEINKIELAMEEALVNIIEHAYSSQPGTVEITYHFFPNDHVELIIRDFGEPFNPLDNGKEIDTQASLEEREVGGLGIALIQKLMDDIEYSRDRNANVLTLKKKCA